MYVNVYMYSAHALSCLLTLYALMHHTRTVSLYNVHTRAANCVDSRMRALNNTKW